MAVSIDLGGALKGSSMASAKARGVDIRQV